MEGSQRTLKAHQQTIVVCPLVCVPWSVPAEQFARTINRLKGKVTMLFIAHQLPKGLQVDGVVKLGEQTRLTATEKARS